MSAWEEPVIPRKNSHSRLRICANGLAPVSLKELGIWLNKKDVAQVQEREAVEHGEGKF